MTTKLLLFSTLIFASSEIGAQVSLPYYDGFDYAENAKLITAGTSSGLGDWNLPFGATGSSADPFVIISPSWALPTNLPAATGNAVEFVGGGDDPEIDIPNQGATGVIYSSFMFRVSDQSGLSANASTYFYSFAQNSSNNNGLNYTSCVYIQNVDANTFKLGISENNNTTNAVWSGDNYKLNQDLFIVIAYDIDNATSKMWINPTITGTTEPVASLVTNETATSTRTNLDKVRINLDANSKTPTIILDEVRVGNAWKDVAPDKNTMATAESDFSNSISLYPTVATEQLNIHSKNQKINAVQIFDTSGKRVYVQTGGNSINVSKLTKGVYFVKINANGKTIAKKFVKN